MKRERRALLKDMVRRYAQGVIESLELIWQFEEINDEEEVALMQREIDAIAKRIGANRSFVSTAPAVEYGPTPGCKQCEEAESCGFTDCPECDAQLHEDVNGTGFRSGYPQ